MKKDRSMMNRNEFLVAKAVRIDPNHLENLLVSGHVDEVTLSEETDGEYIVTMKVALPKKALEGVDPKEAILSSNYFIVGELPQTAITKEMRQVCEVVPSNSCLVRYEAKPDVIPPASPKMATVPEPKRKGRK